MAWWRDARFGMFIHWGLYAEPAGEWNGEQIKGISEWIMLRAKIPVAEYEKIAETFNPKKYDAEAWVKLAKMAEIIPGLGLYAFMALIFMIAAVHASMDHDMIWDRLEALER